MSKNKPINPLSGISIQLRAYDGRGTPYYELRLGAGSEFPAGLEQATHEIERQFCSLYPAYNTHLLRKQMKHDPDYAAYEKLRIELTTRYPGCGVPTNVL